MEGSLPVSSFKPPTVARATARFAPWALLETKAYLAASDDDATAAEAVTSTGRTIKVTFCLADPPGLSHFCVHSPDFQHDDFMMEPQVLSSSMDLVLLRVTLTTRPGCIRRETRVVEYLVYNAGRGKPSSLTSIPHTPKAIIDSSHVCVLSFDDGESFLLANLLMTRPRSDYQLHVFSSKTGGWTATPLQLQTPSGGQVCKEDLPSPRFHKVIALGGGAVGWVDLWSGIVRCNVLDHNPILTFIPIPILELNPKREGEARLVRDVVASRRDGIIKFVELDLRVKEVAVHINKTRRTTKDLDTIDVIHDAELLFHDDDDDACAYPVQHHLVGDGWKLRTCYRHTSWDYWRKGHSVDVDEISVDDPGHRASLPQLWDAEAGRWTLRNLHSSCYPVLGIDDGGGDVVYLMSTAGYRGRDAWMIGVDLVKKTVGVVAPVSSARVWSFEHGLFEADFLLACEISEYLNATPSTSADGVAQGATNGVQDWHLPSDYITPNNLPRQQNMWNSGYHYNGCFNGNADGDGTHQSNSYGKYQHPPPSPASFHQDQGVRSESGERPTDAPRTIH